MKHLLIAAATVLMMHSALAAEPDTEFRQQVNAFVDSWHDGFRAKGPGQSGAYRHD